jgi:uncharacterized protein YdeI (YjbR/CyaY-like superfamily)
LPNWWRELLLSADRDHRRRRSVQSFPDVDSYIDASDRWPDEIQALRPLLLATRLDECIKWGKPCYALGDANIVIVQEFSDHLALMFFKGILLDDPAGVLEDQGPNSHAAKRMTFSSVEDVRRRADLVTAYVSEAIAVEEAGTPLPPRPEEDLADELRERLADDPDLSAAFDDLTPGRQREYNLHISSAKQASTRQSRVDKIVPRILHGKGLRDR